MSSHIPLDTFARKLNVGIKQIDRGQHVSSAKQVQQELHAQNLQLVQSIKVLASRDSRDEVAKTLEKSSETMQEMEDARHAFITQMEAIFIQPAKQFLQNEIGNIKNCGKEWENSIETHEMAVSQYLAKRSKDNGLEQAANLVTETRKDLQKKSVTLAHKLNEFLTYRRNEPLHELIGLFLAQDAFHHQAYEMSRDVRPSLQSLASILHSSPKKSQDLETWLHHIDSSTPISPRSAKSLESIPKKQGWLMKKTTQKIRNVWTRGYFILNDTSLIYTDNGEENQIDLRVCMVRQVRDTSQIGDRRFVFEIVSPTRSYLLQAESEQDVQEWISHVQAGVGRSLHIERPSRDPSPGKVEIKNETLKHVLSISGNSKCADCDTSGPEWASYSLGLTLCLTCSGIHRGLGSISKIRSLTLDSWEPELLGLMDRLGNDVVNRECFESSIRNNSNSLQAIRPTPSADRSVKTDYILNKYSMKMFMAPLGGLELDGELGGDVNQCFWSSIKQGNLPAAMRYLQLQADVNWINFQDEEKRTALHMAVDNKDLAAIEFLLMNQASIDVRDARGWTSMHHAVHSDHPRLVLLLLKRSPKLDTKNDDGLNVIDFAKKSTGQNVGLIVGALQLYKFELHQGRKQGTAIGNHIMSQALATMMEDLLLKESTEALSREPCIATESTGKDDEIKPNNSAPVPMIELPSSMNDGSTEAWSESRST